MVLFPGCGCCGGDWGCAMTQECVDALVGACCMPDGSCQQLNKWQCDTAGGRFIGPGLPCRPGVCDPCTDCHTPCNDCPKAWPQGWVVTFQTMETIAGGNTTDARAIAAAKARIEAVTFSANILVGSTYEPAERLEDCVFGAADCGTRQCADYNGSDWFIISNTGENGQGGKVRTDCNPAPGVTFYGGQIVQYFTTAEWDSICATGAPNSVRKWGMSFVPMAEYSGGIAWEFKKMDFPDPCESPVQPVVVEADVLDVVYNTPNAEGDSRQTVVLFRTAITLTPIPYTP